MKRTRNDARHEHCRELLLEIARGVEGDLPPAKRRVLRQHLRECHRCGAFSTSLRETVELCRSLGQEPLARRTLARARANVARLLGAKRTQEKPRARRRVPKRPPSRG
jgi:anti-sigma factor RsiW